METSTLENKALAVQYYRQILRVVNDCASLCSARELRDRFDGGTETTQDLRFLRRRYHDNLNELDAKISSYEQACLEGVKSLNAFCKENGISSTTTKPEELISKLMVAKRRSAYRHQLKIYEREGTLPPLWRIESDYERAAKKAARA